MKTYADLGAKLLEDAAVFYSSLGNANPQIAAKMADNAAVYRTVADFLKKDPLGKIDPSVKIG